MKPPKDNEPRFVLHEARQCIEMSRRLKNAAVRKSQGWDGGGLKVICEALLLLSLTVVSGALAFMFCIHGKGAAWASDLAFAVALWALGATALLGVILLGIHFFLPKS